MFDEEMACIHEEIVSAQVSLNTNYSCQRNCTIYQKDRRRDFGRSIEVPDFIDVNNEHKETDDLLELKREIAAFYQSIMIENE